MNLRALAKTFAEGISRSEGIPPEERVPIKAKIGYAVGDFGANFQFQSVTIFLLIYFTDTFGLNPADVGLIFLVSKIWDAISDPTMGYLSDRTESRWGKRRPYLLFGAIPLGITLFLLYAAPPIESYGWKIVYAVTTFIAVLTAYTVVNVPYGALTANMTLDSRERANLTGFRMMGAIMGTLLVATITRPLVGSFPNQIIGFRVMGVIYGLAIAICSLVTFFSVRERHHAGASSGGLKFKDLLTVIKNAPVVLLFLGIFFHYAGHFIFLASVSYFFKYVLKEESFIPAGFFFLYCSAAVMLPFMVTISNRWSKKLMFNGGMALFAIGSLCLFFVHSYSFALLSCIYIVLGLGLSAVYQGPWSTIPDTVEYVEWKTALRREGVIYGIFFFGMKLSAGFSGFVVGKVLAWGGYLQPAKGQATAVLTAQPDSALTAIRISTTLLPMASVLLGMLFIFLYPINHRVHSRITREINARKASGK